MARCCGVCQYSLGATPEQVWTDQPYLPLERLRSGARLEGVIPFQARVHLPWERLPGRTHTWRDAAEYASIPWERLPSKSGQTSPILPLERLRSGARLEGVIPFQARVHLPWERLPGRTHTWRDAAEYASIPWERLPSKSGQTSPIYLWSDSGAEPGLRE